MSSEEKYFSDFSQTWPKGVFAKPVMGERGNHDLPSGTEGGEKMDLDLHYEHKQHTFDRFCKTTIKHEAYNAFRQIRNQKNRFVSLSELSEDASEQLAVYDFYPWEYTAFPVDGDVILIKDDRLAEALTTLPQEFRGILLMYWFLQNPYIYLSVAGDDMVFQITACFITDIGFDYIAPDPEGQALTDFFAQVARKNWLAFDGVTFGEEDTVLTLSTCCRKYDMENTGNLRLVVMAKLLPEGAAAQDFTVRAVSDPEMP